MADYPTLELWVFEKLRQSMGEIPAVVKTEGAISVTQTGGQDIDKFISVSEFEVEALWESKTDASTYLKTIQSALRALDKENFIISVAIQAENSRREDSPALWSYICIVQIRHRRRETWQA